jgi:hypothetical protein
MRSWQTVAGAKDANPKRLIDWHAVGSIEYIGNIPRRLTQQSQTKRTGVKTMLTSGRGAGRMNVGRVKLRARIKQRPVWQHRRHDVRRIQQQRRRRIKNITPAESQKAVERRSQCLSFHPSFSRLRSPTSTIIHVVGVGGVRSGRALTLSGPFVVV